YSNWVWVLGAIIIVVAVAWSVTLIIVYRGSKVEKQGSVKTLGQLQRGRYNRHIAEVQEGFAAGHITARDAHFALASLIRAAATEKTGLNIESQTSLEVAQNLPMLPLLTEALRWCENETFPPQGATAMVQRGAELASKVVNG
ncbi:MAG: hypothetical protein KAZ70_01010, partial [Actinomyces sp.]|nr:hypothetical protein [Actinomyces sp.]